MADIATIKANIRKMLEQGATEADVDRYVKLEGVTAEQLRADQSSRMGAMPPGMVETPSGYTVDTRAAAEIGRRRNPVMQGVADAAGQMIGGIPFVGSYLDEAASAVSTNPGMAREMARSKLSTFEEANPKTAMGLQFAGALGSVAPLGAAALGTGAGRAVVSSLPRMTMTGAAAGATEGAAYGYGAGTSPKSRRDMAMLQGGIGAVAGAFLPSAAKLVSKGISGIRNFNAGRKLRKGTGLKGREQRLAQTLLGNDLPVDGRAIMHSSDNAASLGGALAAMPGEAAKILRGAVRENAQGAASRVRSVLDETLGPAPNIVDARNAINSARHKQAAPLYESAFKAPGGASVDVTPIVKGIRDRMAVTQGDVRKSLKKALSYLQSDNGAIRTDMVEPLHHVRRALWDDVEKLKRAGLGNAAEDVKQVWKDLTNAMNKASADYKGATDVYKGFSSVKDAFEKGRGAFRPGMHRDELAAYLKGASKADVDAARLGARSAIQDTVERNANQALTAAREFDAKEVGRRKLKTVFGKGPANRVGAVLRKEADMARKNARIAGNSETAARHFANQELNKGIGRFAEGGAGMGFVADGPKGVGRGLMLGALKGAAGKVTGPVVSRSNERMARMLTATGPEQRSLIQALMKANQSRAASGVDPLKQALISYLLAKETGRNLAPVLGPPKR